MCDKKKTNIFCCGCLLFFIFFFPTSIFRYLHAMGVSDLAIEAAMKAEAEDETYHIISIVQSHLEQKYTITRKSRMSDTTTTHQIGEEKIVKQKSGREHRSLVTVSMDSSDDSKNNSPRLVERTVLKSDHTFTVTRTLVGENAGQMNCIQVLRTPSTVVVTRRWFLRASTPHDKDDGTDFLKEMEAMEDHVSVFFVRSVSCLVFSWNIFLRPTALLWCWWFLFFSFFVACVTNQSCLLRYTQYDAFVADEVNVKDLRAQLYQREQ